MPKLAHARIGLIVFVGLIATGFLGSVLLATQPAEGPEEVIIKSELWGEKKHEDFAFSHKTHAAELNIACDRCHHIFENGKNVWQKCQEVQKCEECHTVNKTGKALREASEEEKKLSLYNAFHDQCRGCHKEQEKGPVKCTECHKRKK